MLKGTINKLKLEAVSKLGGQGSCRAEAPANLSRKTVLKCALVAIAVIGLPVLIVVLQNTLAVETNLLFLTVTMPSAAWLFATLIIGFAIGVLSAGQIVSVAKRTVGIPSAERSNAAA